MESNTPSERSRSLPNIRRLSGAIVENVHHATSTARDIAVNARQNLEEMAPRMRDRAVSFRATAVDTFEDLRGRVIRRTSTLPDIRQSFSDLRELVTSWINIATERIRSQENTTNN